MQEINLYDLIKYYARNWVFIAILTTLGLIGGDIYNNFIQTPMYKSNATLLVVNLAESAPQDVTKINNYVELFKSRSVLVPVMTAQHLDATYDKLVKSIDATNEKDTEVIKVSISSDNPNTSKALVAGAIDSFMKQVSKLYAVDNVRVVDEASTATSPFNVHKGLQLVLATTVGFITSCIVLFFVYDFNNNRTLIKRANRKVAKNRVLHNAGIILTGRVGFAQPIKKTTSPSIAKKPRVATSKTIAISVSSTIRKVLTTKPAAKSADTKASKVVTAKSSKVVKAALKKPTTRVQSTAAKKARVATGVKKTPAKKTTANKAK